MTLSPGSRLKTALTAVPFTLLNNHIRKNIPLTKILFGVTVAGSKRIHWDFTTIALRNVLTRYIHEGDNVLEMGTGPYALLSIYLRKRINCRVTACDINQEYIQNACDTAQQNAVTVEVFQSDLFDHVDRRYKCIFFNAVYIPRSDGIRYGIDRLHDTETDWCGGKEGSEVIRHFLEQAPNHLETEGTVLLGYNPIYLKTGLLRRIIENCQLGIEKNCSSRINPSNVVVLRKE